MPTLAWMKKLASILLLVCFVLPLSRCTPKMAPPGEPQEQVSFLYAYEIAGGSVENFDESPGKSLVCLGAVLLVFFVPLIAIGFSAAWQPRLLAAAALPSLYFLYGWTTFYYTPDIGGILAAECWLFLFVISASTLCSRWFGRRKLRAAEPA